MIMREEFAKYYSITKKLKTQANALWSTVSFITVADIVNRDIDLQELDRKCWDLKKIEMDSRREASRKIEGYAEEEYEGELEEIDNELDELFRVVSNKLDAVDDVISDLRKIEEKSEEGDYLKLFGDISFMKVEESVKFIELKRFQK